MINKYQLNHEFLVFGENITFPEELNISLIAENVSLKDNLDLPIYDYNDLLISLLKPKTKTTDKILFNYNIKSFNDLRHAYLLVKHRALDAPKRIRDHIEIKYKNILNVLPDYRSGTDTGNLENTQVNKCKL